MVRTPAKELSETTINPGFDHSQTNPHYLIHSLCELIEIKRNLAQPTQPIVPKIPISEGATFRIAFRSR